MLLQFLLFSLYPSIFFYYFLCMLLHFSTIFYMCFYIFLLFSLYTSIVFIIFFIYTSIFSIIFFIYFYILQSEDLLSYILVILLLSYIMGILVAIRFFPLKYQLIYLLPAIPVTLQQLCPMLWLPNVPLPVCQLSMIATGYNFNHTQVSQRLKYIGIKFSMIANSLRHIHSLS